MVQNIRFKGLNLAVDEQAVENGALAVCDGMELHNGALRPCVIDGEEVATISGEVLFIHETGKDNKNVIYAGEDSAMYYVRLSEEGQPAHLIETDASLTRDKIKTFVAIGNTIVVSTQDGMRYYKWINEGYKYLGEMPPELELDFWMASGKHIMHDLAPSVMTRFLENLIDYNSREKTERYLPYFKKVLFVMHMFYSKSLHISNSDYNKSENLILREEVYDAALNTAIEACHNANCFVRPFYIRYCYRLWDGRKIMHSAPILMFGDVSYPEAVSSNEYQYFDSWGYQQVIPIIFPQHLFYQIKTDIAKLKEDWSDVVKSIDIYMTPEMSRYDDKTKVEITESGSYPDYGRWIKIATNVDTEPDEEDLATDVNEYYSTLLLNRSLGIEHPNIKARPVYSQSDSLYKNWGINFYDIDGWSDDREHYTLTAALPANVTCQHMHPNEKGHGIFYPRPQSEKIWKKRLVEQNAYYLLYRFNLQEEELETIWRNQQETLDTDDECFLLPIENSTINNIEVQEQMISNTSPDDYLTHNSISAETAYVYNNRVNLAGIVERPYSGFRLSQMMPRVERTNIICRGFPTSYMDAINTLSFIIVRLQTDSGDVYVKKANPGIESAWFLRSTFIFYPDARAKEMWLYYYDRVAMQQKQLTHFDLQEHPFLNGAYHMGNFADTSTLKDMYKPATIDVDTIPDNPEIDLSSYIFASVPGNPFVFPAASRNQLGVGKVLAIASATKALSQGQLGQFSLLAFATDGIWALPVNKSGSYGDPQSISREVITNAKGLLQLDQSIAFVTKRAISQLMGSDVKSISDTLSGPMRDLSTLLGYLPATKEMHNLIGAVQNAEALYDFANRRLLYFIKEDEAFTGDVLVMCADDDAWAFKSLGSTVKGIYNSYPYPYIHKADGKLVQLSEPYDNKDEGAYEGIIVSRTIKSEGVRNAVRGFFQDYDIDLSGDTDKRPMLMIWGSDDNRTWHYVGKSNAREMSRLAGRIYKYFRIAVKFTGMKKNDLYHSLDLDIQERFTR